MNWLVSRVSGRLRVVASTALPSLRVIGMAYTGLIGVGAMALVVSVAFLPAPAVLQQATQPARDAVANLVQPATDVVTNLIVGSGAAPRAPFFQFRPAPHVAVASGLTSDDVVPHDTAVETAVDQPIADEASPTVTPAPVRPARILVASASVAPAPDVTDPNPNAEDVPADEPAQTVDARDRSAVHEIALALADGPVQQEANVEAPRPLPPPPSPTEGPLQLKARLDVENQAAIDAAKASLVRRKAQADAANQAAIDIRKAASATVVATPGLPELVAPTAATQTRVAGTVDNKALIDAAKTARARARADANAANQAAIDVARALRSPAKATSTPTSQAVPPTSTPTPTLAPSPTAEPTPTRAASATSPVVTAEDPASVDTVDVQTFDLEEAPVMLAEDVPQN